MKTDSMPSDGQAAPRILIAGSPGGGSKALFMPSETAAGRAEVASMPLPSLRPLGGGPVPGPGHGSGGGGIPGVGGIPGFSVTFGWIWIVGNQPICKTRHVIGAADGTTFFVRTSPAIEQFYFIGPSSSRVRLSELPTSPGRPETIIDAVHRYAEHDGRSLVRRNLSETSSDDEEFLRLVAKARESAVRAGLVE